METQTENRVGKSSVSLGGTEPYELYDQAAEEWHSFKTADEVIKKADEIKASQFSVYMADGIAVHVNKKGGVWLREDGKYLHDLEFDDAENARLMHGKEVRKAEEMESMRNVEENSLGKLNEEELADNAILPVSLSSVVPVGASAASKPYTRPMTLLGGKFVGNEKGEYRRQGESAVALIDSDEKIKFKDRKFGIGSLTGNVITFQAGAELAKAKGWQAIEVTGTERFRREAWFYAKLHGLEVVGFEPNAKDIKRLETTQQEQLGQAPSAPMEMARKAGLDQAEKKVLRLGGGLQKVERGDGRCIGPVVFQNDYYAVQNVGRDVYRIHDKTRLDDKTLHQLVNSKVVEIHYSNGSGTVKDVGRRRGIER